MITLDFSYNWNNKLSCTRHTTLRLRNDAKYFVGQRVEEQLKGRKLQEADIAAVKPLYLHDINEFIAGVDTGYTAEKCREIIQTMYKNKNIDWEKQQLVLVLLVVDKNTQLMPGAVNDKIALFCRKYEQHVTVKYKVCAADSAKVKGLPLEEKVLDHYFTSANFLFRGKWSIANLAKYWNELRAEMAGATRFPNKYDAEFERKLSTEELPQYHQHLISIGYRQVYSPGGGTQWKKQ